MEAQKEIETYLVFWTNWKTKSKDMKMLCKRPEPCQIPITDIVFYSISPTGGECPAVKVTASSDEEACDKAGPLFDEEKYRLKRDEI
jgi:hypothetical protein